MITKITSFHRNPYFYSFIYCFNIILSTKMAGFVLMKLHICPETSYICINVTFGEKIVLQLFHHFWKKLTVLSLPVWCHPYRLLLCVHFLILYVFIISVIFCSLLMVIILQYSYWVLQQDSGQSHFFFYTSTFSSSLFLPFRTKNKTPKHQTQNKTSVQNKILQKLYNKKLYHNNHCSNKEKTYKTQTVLQQFTQFPHASPLTYTVLPRDLSKQHF